jgi:glycosyltransferase involved in cell wall biosynthesis
LKIDGTAIVVAPSGQLNLMGRALSLAELLDQATQRVSVFTPDTGPLWPPASRWQADIRRGGNPAQAYSELPPGEVRWIWLVKPLRDGYRAARQAMAAFPEARFILDVDDDDEGLSREFTAESPLNWVRLLRSPARRQLLPGSIARTRRRALGDADAFTAASYAVAERCGLPEAETLRLVHSRSIPPRASERSPDPSGSIHLGFFGTVRPHKGIRSIAELVESDPDVRLHLFAGYDPTGQESIRPQVIEHPIDEPQNRQFESVDVVLLPQERSSAGEVQLPAKLLDAMRFGVPILATPTEAITEVAGETLIYVEDWDDAAGVRAKLSESLDRGSSYGAEARRLFEDELSIEAQLPAVRSFLERE